MSTIAPVEGTTRRRNLFACDKAVFRVVPRGSSIFVGDLSEALQYDSCQFALTGRVDCPRGCGTAIQWALAVDVSDYKEQFLVYLYQQLCWTICPDHDTIRPQRRVSVDSNDTALRPAAAIVIPGPRYANSFE